MNPSTWDFDGVSLPSRSRSSAMTRQTSHAIATSTPAIGPRELAMREWFAVHVWTGREALTAFRLQQRGYEVFLPEYEERRRWSDRIKIARKSLFAGYVFCRSRAEVLDKVVATPGVVRIVGDSRGPLSVPAEEIDAIQRLLATRLGTRPWPFLEGQKVRIEVGPLCGLEGIVVKNKNEHRLVVAIALLQRSVSVEIEQEWVVQASAIHE
jgi:transcription antitermination factor NusG